MHRRRELKFIYDSHSLTQILEISKLERKKDFDIRLDESSEADEKMEVKLNEREEVVIAKTPGPFAASTGMLRNFARPVHVQGIGMEA